MNRGIRAEAVWGGKGQVGRRGGGGDGVGSTTHRNHASSTPHTFGWGWYMGTALCPFAYQARSLQASIRAGAFVCLFVFYMRGAAV